MRFSEEGKEERCFANVLDARSAYESGGITLHQPIKVRVESEIIDTTVGRLIFNEVLPSEMGFINRTIDKGDIKKITADVHRLLGNRQTAEFVDNLTRWLQLRNNGRHNHIY